MKYAICYDGPGRLRLRLGQHAFSEKEGWGIASILRQKSGVERVRTCAQNGSILIYYGKDIAKEIGELKGSQIAEMYDDSITRCEVIMAMAENSKNLLAYKWKNVL